VNKRRPTGICALTDLVSENVFGWWWAVPRYGRVGFDRQQAGQANVQVANLKLDQATPVARLVCHGERGPSALSAISGAGIT
jgi:hypothetical protein